MQYQLMNEAHDLTTNWIEKWAKYSPDAVAFVDGESGKSYTFKQSLLIIKTVASKLLKDFKIERGDRIAVLANSHAEYVFLLGVAQYLGALLVPINFRLTAHEVEHIVTDSGAKVLIFDEEYLSIAKHLTEAESASKKALKFTLTFATFLDWTQNPLNETDHVPFLSLFNDPCMILYTSGTTGAPKGAVLTNATLFWNSVNTSLRLNLSQNDVTVSFLPFFHTGGWNVLTTPFIHRGAKSIFLKKFDGEKILELCESEKVTILFGVPTTMGMMSELDSFSTRDLSSVRYAIVGGEPMPIPLIQKWEQKGVPVRQGYGLTEFGPNVFSLNEADSIRKIGSIGFANFYIETRVIDPNGNDLGPNQVGELLLRGPMCMKEYWQNPEATQKTFMDGWLLTGDLVRYDEEGYFYVVGRKKEMFISGGENVYPAEIEKTLQSMPQIREAAVIGVPHDKWGEVGKAFVVAETSLTEVQVMEFCASRLAKFKVPQSVVFLKSLPKGDSGKILKRELLRL